MWRPANSVSTGPASSLNTGASKATNKFFASDVETVSYNGIYNGSEASISSALFSEVVSNEVQVAVSRLPVVSDEKPSKNWNPLVAHSTALAGYALNDVLYYACNTTVSSPGVLCLVLVPYVAAACWATGWATRSRHRLITRRCACRLSVFLFTVMHVIAALLSCLWREEFRFDIGESTDNRVAYSVALLQVLAAVCYPLDVIDVGLGSVMSLFSVLAFRWAQAVPAMAIVEDGVLIACTGIACGIMGGSRRAVDLKETDVSQLLQLFAPFHMDSEKRCEAQQVSKLRTNLDRLIIKIAKVRDNIKASEGQSEWLEVLSSVLKSILNELTQVGSLMNVDECELSHETPALREYFKKTFGAQAAGKHNPRGSFAIIATQGRHDPVENTAATSGKEIAGVAANVTSANCESVEQAVRQMTDFFENRDPNHIDATHPSTDFTGAVQELMSKRNELGSWQFDIFKFSSLCDGHALLVAGMEALKESAGKLQLQISKITTFLDRVEARYHSSNPYHNSLHAADVVSSMTYFLKLQNTSLMNLTVIERFSGILASSSHDVGHTGQANRYHANALTPLAVLFNDQAILESMHSAITFAILQTQECNFLSRLDAAARSAFRGLVVHMILDTDLSRHVQTISRFRQEMLSDGTLKHNVGHNVGHNVLNPNQRKELLSFILKSADVGGSSKPFDYHSQWTMRINTEFFEQGDKEKKLGLMCSPFCDRVNTHVAESQRGFFKFIVMPLYGALDEYLSNSRMRFEMLPEMKRNFDFWVKYQGEDFDYTNPMDNTNVLKRAFAELMKAAQEDHSRASGFGIQNSCDGTTPEGLLGRPLESPRRKSEPELIGFGSFKRDD